MSEQYQRKILKAQKSINDADSVRSIVKSLRENSLNHQITINLKINPGLTIKLLFFSLIKKKKVLIFFS